MESLFYSLHLKNTGTRMSFPLRFFALMFILAGLAGCAHTPQQSSAWIEFNANQPAAQTLRLALENHGYITRQRNYDQIEVEYGQGIFIMEPRIQAGRLSRIVVSQIYPIKAEYQDNPEIFITLSTLNTKLNCAKYIVLPGNQAAEVQSSMTFIDERISLREVELFMAWMQNRIKQASTLVPEDTLRMFEF
jgi:hypothetical protein